MEINRVELEGYVDAGIALLDEKCAFEDWRSKIDLVELDLFYPSYCVLGQIYGSYHEALDDFGFNDMFIYGMSYTGDYEEGDEEWVSRCEAHCAALTEIWREKLS